MTFFRGYYQVLNQWGESQCISFFPSIHWNWNQWNKWHYIKLFLWIPWSTQLVYS